MRFWPFSRRAALIALAAVFALPAAGVFAATTLRSSAETATGPPRTVATGTLETGLYSTMGTVSVVEFPDGRRDVVLRNFRTWGAPELYVDHVSMKGDRMVTRRIAPLKNATGNQRYDFPRDAPVGNGARIVIFCDTCGAIWGEARLKPQV